MFALTADSGSNTSPFCAIVPFVQTCATRCPPTNFASSRAKKLPTKPCAFVNMLTKVFSRSSNNPPIGIGARGYLILHPAGNIAFEATGFYSPDALDLIDARGGIRFSSASHPHAYGAGWQLQERFNPKVVIHVADLTWTNTLHVAYPMDDKLELHAGYTLHHTGGHFDGHTILHLAERKILFAGDALKFHLADSPTGISCYKAFNRRLPLSHTEIERYAAVIGNLDFDETYTTFEHSPHRDATLRAATFGASVLRRDCNECGREQLSRV